MVSASAGRRPCSLSGTRPRQRPREPLQYHQFVFARHSTRRGLPNPGFPPSAFSVSTYSKASPSPSIRLPHHPFPYSNNLTCLQFVVGLVIAKFRYAHASCLPGSKSSTGFRKVVPRMGLVCSVVWLQYGRALCADDWVVRSPGQSAHTLSQCSAAPS